MTDREIIARAHRELVADGIDNTGLARFHASARVVERRDGVAVVEWRANQAETRRREVAIR